ncbi:MAG: NAD(P)H-quinone oxidoreductase [bacterium]|nr:NAD(P)H-quinone oxidoreductase [bacterium]
MRAVYIEQFGGVENLAIRAVPDPPKPKGREVVVRVRAAGMNRADLLQRKGLYPAPEGYSTNIPGLEFAGEVIEVSDEVSSWKPSDRVMAITAGEAQAEIVAVDESVLMRIPDGLSYSDAAAIPEAFITAHDAIFTLGDLRADQTLLVHAVASGVGIAAMQMAKQAGVIVIGTSRTGDKLERCRKLGLDHGIATVDAKFADKVVGITDGKGADVILDLVGASYFNENLPSLAIKGRLILVGLTGGATAEFDLRRALQKRARIIGTVLRGRSVEEKADATRAFVAHSMREIESGAILPIVDKVFPLDQVREAHEYLESNQSFGKVILEF